MLKNPTRPTVRYFYHYSCANHLEWLEWLESIILKSELYFPTLIQLNDPADARPRLIASSSERFAAFVNEAFVASNPGMSDEYYQQNAAINERTIRKCGTDPLLRGMTPLFHREQDNLRIYSLSKRWDNLSMWAKYAGDHEGKHRGYCLEFANEGSPFASALEVIYDDGPVTLDMTDEEQIKAHYIFHKLNDWRCEEEVRIPRPRGYPSVVPFDPKLLTRIILGKDMAEAHRTTIREWAQKRSPELVVVCAEYDEFEQKLIVPGDPPNGSRKIDVASRLSRIRKVLDKLAAIAVLGALLAGVGWLTDTSQPFVPIFFVSSYLVVLLVVFVHWKESKQEFEVLKLKSFMKTQSSPEAAWSWLDAAMWRENPGAAKAEDRMTWWKVLFYALIILLALLFSWNVFGGR